MSHPNKSNDLIKLYSDFRKQEKKSIKFSLIEFIEVLEKPFELSKDKKKIDYRHSLTDDFLSIVYQMPSLNKKFWEREVMSNIDTLITVPFYFQENKNIFLASAYRKTSNSKLKVSLTHVFGYYNYQTQQFIWNPRELYPLEVMTHYHNNLFKDLDILNHSLIENITCEQSYKIAYFYRILFYACRIEYFKDNISKHMNNENLVIHEVVYPEGKKKKYFTIFTLMDLGVKEPPLNKSTLEDLEFEIRWPFYSYKSLRKNKSLSPKKNSHKLTMKPLSKDKKKKKFTQKNLLQKIKKFIFK